MDEVQKVLEEFVDFLMPLLTPYEATVYLYLLRRSHFDIKSDQIRVGQRTIAKGCGQATQAKQANQKQILVIVRALATKGCISIGDSTREGTLYSVKLPNEVPAAKEQMAASEKLSQPLDYYRDPNCISTSNAGVFID